MGRISHLRAVKGDGEASDIGLVLQVSVFVGPFFGLRQCGGCWFAALPCDARQVSDLPEDLLIIIVGSLTQTVSVRDPHILTLSIPASPRLAAHHTAEPLCPNE